MKKTTIIIALAVVMTIGMTGCATNLARPAATTDYGQPPSNYEATIKQHFETMLKDPESARYRIGTPRKAYGNEGVLLGGGIRWTGYLVKTEVNARNSFGGYVGYKPYLILFSNDAIFKAVPGAEHVLIHEVE